MARAAASILIVAGEASGEMYGALLAERLKERCPGVSCFGMGGDRMARAGVELVQHIRDASKVGIIEVLGSIPRLYGIFKSLLAAADRRKPAMAVLIDFPDFNLLLARSLRKRGIKVAYYIGPTVWAWRAGRIKKIAARVNKMVIIFPFEEPLYRAAGVDVDYVGHPLATLVKSDVDRADFLKKHGLDSCDTIVGLMPGSRASEIDYHMPVLLEAARLLHSRRKHVGFVLPLAQSIGEETVAAYLESLDAPKALVVNDTYNAASACDALVVSSGTATLEVALLGRPFLSVYRISPVTYRLGRGLLKVSDFCIVNLILGRRVVPELIQEQFTPVRVVKELEELLDREDRRLEMSEAFRELRSMLGEGDASARAADSILKALEGEDGVP